MSRTTRVALFNPTLGGGGAERVLVNLSRAFSTRGIATELWLVRKWGPLLAQVDPSVAVHELGPSYGAALLRMTARLRSDPPTAVLSALNPTNVIAALAHRAAGRRTRLVLSQHSHVTGDRPENYSWRSPLFPPLAKALFPLADAVVAVSDGVARDMESRLGLRGVHVIHNPFELEAIRTAAQQSVVHPWFDDRSVPIVVCVGRFHPPKDVRTVLRAMKRLVERRPARLVLVGDGPERPAVDALVSELGLQDRVLLTGFIDNPHAWTARAQCALLSSRAEGFGNVLVEALAVGTPAVATDCPTGPSEILDRGRFGALVPVGDADAMAAAIERTLDDPPAKELLMSRAREFEVGAIAERYLSVLLP